MRLSQILAESRILTLAGEQEKAKLLQRLAEVLARDLPGVTTTTLLELFLGRERIASTGIGEGIAIPHARLSLTAAGGKWLTTPMAALLRVENGVAFDAVDGQPVFLVVALVSALENRDDHLAALSACSRLLRNPVTRNRLLAARDREEIHRIVVGLHEESDGLH